jgi:hypothetical protein
VPVCNDGQVPFAIKPYYGSYVDLISKNGNCGLVPKICLRDFEKNGMEKSVDDFYQSLYSLSINNQANDRIVPAINFVETRFRFFYFPLNENPDRFSSRLITGCAIEVDTKNQTIYQVESISDIK